MTRTNVKNQMTNYKNQKKDQITNTKTKETITSNNQKNVLICLLLKFVVFIWNLLFEICDFYL